MTMNDTVTITLPRRDADFVSYLLNDQIQQLTKETAEHVNERKGVNLNNYECSSQCPRCKYLRTSMSLAIGSYYCVRTACHG